jgi:peptide/nickel transport system permease protein
MTTVSPNTSQPLTAVTGVQLAQGIGVQEAKGFWADAWGQVVKRAGAKFAIAWLSVLGVMAILAPLIANGHPWLYRELGAGGKVIGVSSPLVKNLSPGDVLLVLGAIAGVVWMLLAKRLPRSERLATIAICAVVGGGTLVTSGLIFSLLRGSDEADVRRLVGRLWTVRVPIALGCAAVLSAGAFFLLPMVRALPRLVVLAVLMVLSTFASAGWAIQPLQTFPYREAVAAGKAEAIFTIVPFSPGQRDVRGDFLPPMATGKVPNAAQSSAAPPHALGTDSFGQDVLSQMLHACRLSISIGLVSTGIAVIIGISIGALMGYFGGWVDLALYRVVEVFMSVPVLFLLIVAAAVLPRSTYVMMAIIGCVTWTGAARFTRAEFMRLRNQDFVQAAQALGLPLRSILFRHMLPNGVTPVLVDASFAVAAAILAEATLSFLGLGPEEQASWGRLLSDATNNAGNFIWWLAIFPGLAIFMSVLSYNMLGEAMRDAIDPKLKKARV